MLPRQAEDQELGQDDHKDEGEIHPQRLSDYSVQENAEPEIKVDVSKGIYRRILQVEY